MNLVGILANIFGIGKTMLKAKADRKLLLIEQSHEIIKARTAAAVSSITNNNKTDNDIDLETVKQMDKTWKDDILVYLWLSPVFVAVIVPFIQASKADRWDKLNEYTLQSWQGLNLLPDWYKAVLVLVVVSTLGFRSTLRKIVNKYIEKKFFIK